MTRRKEGQGDGVTRRRKTKTRRRYDAEKKQKSSSSLRVAMFLAGLFTIYVFSLFVAPSLSGAADGEELFIGLTPFAKGGPPCISCHNVSGIPFPGGGTLGPDLTGIYSKFGPTAIIPTLATLPFPTMKPIFDSRPLTPEEQQNLSAFFQKASTLPPASRTWEIILSGTGGLVILLILSSAIWRHRLLTVRKAMVEQAARTRGARA